MKWSWIVAAMGLVLAGCARQEPLARPPADDAPIVMSGGSFFIASFGKAILDKDATGKILEQSPVCMVTSIVLNGKETPIDASASGDLEFAGQTETITLKFDNTGKSQRKISIQNDNKNLNAWAKPISPGFYRHSQHEWTLEKVDVLVNGTLKDSCRGDCSVVIHTKPSTVYMK